jgi:hypothetical protein
MSQENVEVIRRGFEAWNAGDMDVAPQPLTGSRTRVKAERSYPAGMGTSSGGSRTRS